MEKKDIFSRFPKRKCCGTSITIPDASLSARVLIDRVSEGKPINARMAKHIPLPPDGMIEDDFETGMEDISDVTDAVIYADKIRAEQMHIAKEKEKAIQEQLGATPPPVESPTPPIQ